MDRDCLVILEDRMNLVYLVLLVVRMNLVFLVILMDRMSLVYLMDRRHRHYRF